MTHRLQYLLHLNIQVTEAENKYQKAKISGNSDRIQSALQNLRFKKDALKTYCNQLIREGIRPCKTVNPELF